MFTASFFSFFFFNAAQPIAVQSHACILEERPHPSRGGALGWSLPYSEICYCQAVVAPQIGSTCQRKEEYEEDELWFVNEQQILHQFTMRGNWKKEILDGLLQRIKYCGKDTAITF